MYAGPKASPPITRDFSLLKTVARGRKEYLQRNLSCYLWGRSNVRKRTFDIWEAPTRYSLSDKLSVASADQINGRSKKTMAKGCACGCINCSGYCVSQSTGFPWRRENKRVTMLTPSARKATCWAYTHEKSSSSSQPAL
ncbi:hypothetical protein J1614_005290 [Plenodomus biglobosus]|nr:hypothetical protein J1614_005290 [Plenodomus biglobosus]